MKYILGFVVLSITLHGGEISPRVANLVGPDARFVYGVHIERSRTAVLKAFIPTLTAPDLPAGVHHTIVIHGDMAGGQPPLTILLGAVSVETLNFPNLVPLDLSTTILADPLAAETASRRWSETEPPGPLAATVRRLAESYDNWFVMKTPLANLPRRSGVPLPRHAQELVDEIEEISGGIRFGAFTEVHLEVVAKSADAAAALAVLGRWLPGFIELADSTSPQSQLIDLMEEFTVSAVGRTASLSFVLSESKMQALADRLRAAERQDVP